MFPDGTTMFPLNLAKDSSIRVLRVMQITLSLILNVLRLVKRLIQLSILRTLVDMGFQPEILMERNLDVDLMILASVLKTISVISEKLNLSVAKVVELAIDVFWQST